MRFRKRVHVLSYLFSICIEGYCVYYMTSRQALSSRLLELDQRRDTEFHNEIYLFSILLMLVYAWLLYEINLMSKVQIVCHAITAGAVMSCVACALYVFMSYYGYVYASHILCSVIVTIISSAICIVSQD